MASAVTPLPEGEYVRPNIQRDQVAITPGGTTPAEFSDEAAATLAIRDYEIARAWLDQNAWYMEWEWSDLLHQSPTLNFTSTDGSYDAAPRVSDFTVNNTCETMGGEVKRQIFAQQVPFVLRPRGSTSQTMIDAWTALIEVLLDRMNFEYEVKRGIDCMTLQGTCILKGGWDTRTYIKNVPVRKGAPVRTDMPIGGEQQTPTTESDTFELEPKEITESWPFIEYRELGSTIFDPKWNTPNHPDMCGYAIDIDDVNFDDLEGMRQLDCYNIPDRAALEMWFFNHPEGSASVATQALNDLSSSGSPALHAESETKTTSVNPLETPVKMITRWSKQHVISVVQINGRDYTIRNEDNELCRIPHFSANWRSIQNSGYGIGLGRLTGCEQRVKQGVINHALRSLAYRFNAPLITAQGTNAPTQNVLARLGGFFPVQPIGNNVKNSIAFLDLPPVPPEAWQMLQWANQSEQDTSGADQAFAQGNISKAGSSAARTATGASRIAQKSDQRASGPIDNVAEGIVIPYIEMLIDMIKMQKMPATEIREILSEKFSAQIMKEFDLQKFYDARLEIRVLAGQKLAAKAAIGQVLPFLMQITQQPQLIEQLHAEGKTVDMGVMFDLILQFSELQGQYDLFRPMTEKEQQQVAQAAANPVAAATQGKLAVEQQRGQNEIEKTKQKGVGDAQNIVLKAAVEHATGGGQSEGKQESPLNRAEGYNTRADDEALLRGGIPQI
jgi:hypothetical protein